MIVIEDAIRNYNGGLFRVFRYQCEECNHIFISHSHNIDVLDLYCPFCDAEPKAYPYRRIKSTS